MAMPFLQAEWRKLILANYVVSPEILHPFLPAKTELDSWNDKCYVSLVGFMFLNTRMLGLKIPWHVNFPEVNLRFYVRHFDGNEWKRGVVFIKEIVPKPAISFVANTLYGEHYSTHPMKHSWKETKLDQEVSYSWKLADSWQSIKVQADQISMKLQTASEIEFITEHYWGYSRQSPEKTYEYEVTHPSWEHYVVKNFDIDLDFGENYGAMFTPLNKREPDSVMLAEGSKITVEGKRKL